MVFHFSQNLQALFPQQEPAEDGYFHYFFYCFMYMYFVNELQLEGSFLSFRLMVFNLISMYMLQ